jgi:hexosaminidase
MTKQVPRPLSRLIAVSLVGLVVMLVTAPGASATGACNPRATDLRLTFHSPDHSLAPASWFRAKLTVENRGSRCALGGNWRLFFNFVRQPLAVYPPGPLGDGARAQLAAQGLSVTRADEAQSGDYFVLEPTSDFDPLGPGETREITIDVELWAILKSDLPAGWHISFDGGPARWVPGRNEIDASDPKQTTVFSGDKRPVETPATRFAQNTAPLISLDLADRILPRPLSAERRGGSFTLAKGVDIERPSELRREAAYLESALDDVLRGGGRGGKKIVLALNRHLDVDGDGAADSEGYKLRVSGRRIRIVGTDAAGVLYGIQTLRQLVPAWAYEAAARGRPAKEIEIPRVRIADAPLFGYRGMAIDVARHFESKQTVKKFLDLMAFLKLNRLHFHLTDDEGWRVQIPGLPELTSYGARRGYDLDEDTMLHQAMGSGNDLFGGDNVFGKPANERVANFGRTPAYQGFEQATVNYVGDGSGFYTTSDYEEILAYAKARHIEVIPEFDFPAHARAAVQAMERRYERLAGSDPAAASRYRLLDPNDTSEHRSVQYYTDNLANPCIESTYRFLTKVVTEVRAMYDRAGAPLTMVNIGGDEAPGPNRTRPARATTSSWTTSSPAGTTSPCPSLRAPPGGRT